MHKANNPRWMQTLQLNPDYDYHGQVDPSTQHMHWWGVLNVNGMLIDIGVAQLCLKWLWIPTNNMAAVAQLLPASSFIECFLLNWMNSSLLIYQQGSFAFAKCKRIHRTTWMLQSLSTGKSISGIVELHSWLDIPVSPPFTKDFQTSTMSPT